MATIRHEDEALVLVPLQDSPEAHIVTRQARDLLARLAEKIPEVRKLAGKTDLKRLPPDDPVKKKLTETTVRLDPSIKTFGEAIDALRQAVDVLIYVDWYRLSTLPEESVTVPTSRVTVAAALQHVLGQVWDELDRPGFAVRDGVVVVSTAERLEPKPIVIYDVADLLRAGHAETRGEDWVAMELIDLVTEVIDPDSWYITGGDVGSIWYLDGHIIIRNTPESHQGVKNLLADLRKALGLPGRDEAGVAQRKDAIRQARLNHVLDERLLAFATADGFPENFVDLYDGPTPRDTEWRDGGVLLSVLVTSLDDATLALLRDQRFVIKAQSRTGPFIVGVAPLGRLDDLALLDVVRRIEPASLHAGSRLTDKPSPPLPAES